MQGVSTGNMDCGTLPSFGDLSLDSQFQQEIAIATRFFSPYAASVYVLNECSPNAANAYSTPERIIMFGYYMAQKTILQAGTTLPLAGILAHEWAHQLQFANDWMNTGAPTAAPVELEADAFSGAYMGIVKSWTGPLLNTYFQTLFNLGDWMFNSPSHHGTPNQRVAAGMLGLNLAAQLMRSGQTLSWSQVHGVFAPQIANILYTVQSTPGDRAEKARVSARELESVTSEAAADLAISLDYDLIFGIASGTRSADEFTVMPKSELGRTYIY